MAGRVDGRAVDGFCHTLMGDPVIFFQEFLNFFLAPAVIIRLNIDQSPDSQRRRQSQADQLPGLPGQAVFKGKGVASGIKIPAFLPAGKGK